MEEVASFKVPSAAGATLRAAALCPLRTAEQQKAEPERRMQPA